MFDFFLLLLFTAILLFFFSSSLRAWLLSWFLRRLQRRMQNQMEEQMRAQGSNTGKHQQTQETRHSSGAGKLDMGDIEAKKFDTPRSEDYVEFEELPK